MLNHSEDQLAFQSLDAPVQVSDSHSHGYDSMMSGDIFIKEPAQKQNPNFISDKIASPINFKSL